VTLLYDDGLVAERPIGALRWTVREFVLMHSLLGRNARVPLARWPLPS
jgi:2'-5' RNA ligase